MSELFVVSAVYLGGHKIDLGFSDGARRVVDFMAFLRRFNHPDYDLYLDEGNFKNFVLRDGNIDWNDYHMIFTVDALHSGEL